MNRVLDTVERSAWTFLQAAVGALVGVNVATGSINWQEVLVTAVVAGIVAVLKSLGVTASQINELGTVVRTAKQDPAVAAVVAKAEQVPAVAATVAKVEQSPVVRTSEEVAREVAAQLISAQR